jgi:hypothetical protein
MFFERMTRMGAGTKWSASAPKFAALGGSDPGMFPRADVAEASESRDSRMVARLSPVGVETCGRRRGALPRQPFGPLRYPWRALHSTATANFMSTRPERFVSLYLPVYLGLLSLAAFVLIGWYWPKPIPMLIVVAYLLFGDALFGTQWKAYGRLPAILVRILWGATALYYCGFVYLLFRADKPLEAFIQQNDLPLFAYLVFAGLPFLLWNGLQLLVAAYRLHLPRS